MRFRCVLFGCGWGDYDECPRCGAHPYRGEGYVERGRLYPLMRFWWWLWTLDRYLFWPRCDVCKRRMWPWKKWCCSAECFRKWIPF